MEDRPCCWVPYLRTLEGPEGVAQKVLPQRRARLDLCTSRWDKAQTAAGALRKATRGRRRGTACGQVLGWWVQDLAVDLDPQVALLVAVAVDLELGLERVQLLAEQRPGTRRTADANKGYAERPPGGGVGQCGGAAAWSGARGTRDETCGVASVLTAGTPSTGCWRGARVGLGGSTAARRRAGRRRLHQRQARHGGPKRQRGARRRRVAGSRSTRPWHGAAASPSPEARPPFTAGCCPLTHAGWSIGRHVHHWALQPLT